MSNIDNYIKELDDTIVSDKMKPTGGTYSINTNLNKQITKVHAREILVILNTIQSCAVSDLQATIEEMADYQIENFRKL